MILKHALFTTVFSLGGRGCQIQTFPKSNKCLNSDQMSQRSQVSRVTL